MHDSTGLVSLTDAAEMLSAAGDAIDRSTLSRYVNQHADALCPTKSGRKTVVDFDALKLHRAQNIRLTDAKPFAPQRHRADEQAGKVRAERQIRELDLAERLGKLTLVSEVQDAAHAAVGALRSAFAQAVNDTAEKIASISGAEARVIRPHLRTLESKALESFVRVLADRRIAVPTAD